MTATAIGRLALMVVLSGCAGTALAAATGDGAPGDGNVQLIGRWEHPAPGEYRSNWSTAYLRTAFTGTTLKVRLAAGVGLEAAIDGRPVRIGPWAQGVDLTPEPLAPGTHTLVLASAGQNHEIRYQGLSLEAGAGTSAVTVRPLIEFVGDSITAGPGVGGAATGNYAWLGAEALGCEHVQVAFAGVALASGFGFFGDRTGFDTWYFQLRNCNHHDDRVAWDFSYQPALVVVNLGTNDVREGGRPGEAEFAATYAAFLRAIRARLPTTTLVALRPFGGFQEHAIRQAVATLAQAGDGRVAFVDTAGWLAAGDFSDGIHPTVAGHALAAGRLAAALRPLLPAMAPRP